MSRKPFFFVAANPQTLLIYTWICCNGALHTKISQCIKENRGRKTEEQVIQLFVEQEIQKVEANTLYGRLLRYEASLIEPVNVTVTLHGGSGIYLPDASDEQSAENGQGRIARNTETTIVLDTITADPHLADLLVRLSKTWNGDSNTGGQMLFSFFLTHSQIALQRYKTNAFFLSEFIRLSLEQVAWSDIAATLLSIPFSTSPRITSLTNTVIEDHLALQQALFQELLMMLHGEFEQWAHLSSPHIQELALFLKNFCIQAAHDIP